MSPNENPYPEDYPNQILFIGELEFGNLGCKTYLESDDSTEKRSDDGRYKSTNLQVSMYDLQKDNSVLWKLEEEIWYTYTVFPGSSVKKPLMYEAYTRPVISWSLECELANQNLTRQDFLS